MEKFKWFEIQEEYMASIPRMRFFDVPEPEQAFARECVAETANLASVPRGLQFIFVGKKGGARDAVCSIFAKKACHSFRPVWEGSNEAFYFRYLKTRAVIIFLSENNAFLKQSKKAFIGLLLHEMTHAVLDEKGVHGKIKEQFKRVFVRRMDRYSHPKLNPEELYPLLSRLGRTSRLALKELYMLTWLIERGAGDYLLENYLVAFPQDRCPRAIRVVASEEDLPKHPEDFALVFEFTLILLAVIVPFERMHTLAARKFRKHMEECYMGSVNVLLSSFKGLRDLLHEEFSYSQRFQKKYFEAVFGIISDFIENV